MYVCMYVWYVCMTIYIYIYILRERERVLRGGVVKKTGKCVLVTWSIQYRERHSTSATLTYYPTVDDINPALPPGL